MTIPEAVYLDAVTAYCAALDLPPYHPMYRDAHLRLVVESAYRAGYDRALMAARQPSADQPVAGELTSLTIADPTATQE